MRTRRSKGQSLVETTLILAAFMGLLVGMAGIGGSLFVRQTLAERAHSAARWGAVHPYDPGAIRNIVLYGSATPAQDARPFFGISTQDVEVDRVGCPDPACRIRVAVRAHGIRSVEPVECHETTCDAPSTP